MTKPTMTKSEVIKGLRGQLAFCLVDSRAFNLYREAIFHLERSEVMSENEIKAILKEETKGIRSLKYISDIDWEYHYGNIVNALSGGISKPLPPEDKPVLPEGILKADYQGQHKELRDTINKIIIWAHDFERSQPNDHK